MEKYEVVDIVTAAEVEAAYKHAVEENIKLYRGASRSKHFYGWDARERKLIKNGEGGIIVDGEIWYVNDKYIEPEVEEIEEVPNEAVEEATSEVFDDVDTSIEEEVEEPIKAEEEPVEEVAEVVEEEPTEEIDYKKLCEQQNESAMKLGEMLAEKDIEIEELKGEIAQLKISLADAEDFRTKVLDFVRLMKGV